MIDDSQKLCNIIQKAFILDDKIADKNLLKSKKVEYKREKKKLDVSLRKLIKTWLY